MPFTNLKSRIQDGSIKFFEKISGKEILKIDPDGVDVKIMKRNGTFFMPARQKVPVDYRLDWYFRGCANTAQVGTAVTVHTAMCDIYDPQLLFANAYNTGTWNQWDTTSTLGDLTIKCSIVYNGAVYPVHFNGSDQFVLKSSAFITSDIIGVQIPKNATYYIKTYVSTSGYYPYGVVTNGTTEGFTTTTDTTGSATVTSTVTTASNVYTPYCMIANTSSNIGSVLLIGDSVFRGSNDGSVGYANRALQDAGIGYINVSRPSEKATGFINNNRMYRIKNTQYCTSCISNYGINDNDDSSITVDTIKQNLIRIWTDMASRGMKVFQCTITPHSDSATSDWSTVAKQQVHQYNSKRIQINDWIRTCPAPLSGYFEIADLAETARNSGIWKEGYVNSDGLHPNTVGCFALKAGINTSVLI